MGVYYAKALSFCFSYHAKKTGKTSVKQQLSYKYTEIVTLLATESVFHTAAFKSTLQIVF